jgi:hypothetical protein
VLAAHRGHASTVTQSHCTGVLHKGAVATMDPSHIGNPYFVSHDTCRTANWSADSCRTASNQYGPAAKLSSLRAEKRAHARNYKFIFFLSMAAHSSFFLSWLIMMQICICVVSAQRTLVRINTAGPYLGAVLLYNPYTA